MIILNRLRATRFKQLDDIDLRFSEKGTFLIEGHNEAGKSSLFEAVLFALYGRPLNSDREYKIGDLKQYGAENMEVVLDFSIEGRAFSLARRFAKNHTAKLTTPGFTGDDSETISILTEIDKRVREELRLSPEALLNTCFVEQKHLERLEDMKPDARQAAINELLNLKILTRLQSEFKVTAEHQRSLALQKERVTIAALDEEWPRLQACAEAARRCRLVVQWRDENRRAAALQSQMEDIGKTLEQLSAQREVLETRQLEIARLRERLSTLRGALMLSAQAWATTEQALQQAEQRAAELQELQAALPAHEAQHQEYSVLATQLEKLEYLERETIALEQHRKQARAALEDYDRTQLAFNESRQLQEALEIERTLAQQQLREAEAADAARQSAHRREGKLNLWLAQVEKFRETSQREREAATQLQVAKVKAAGISEIAARLETLQSVRELRATNAVINRDLSDARREVQQAQNELTAAVEKQAQRVQMENERASLESRLREGGATRDAAQLEMRRVEQRAALENWLKAYAADETDAPSLDDFAAREATSQKALDAAHEKTESAGRARIMALAELGAGVMSGIAALLLGIGSIVGIVAAILALALLAFGVWSLVATAREFASWQQEYSRLRSEVDALAGERRASEAQARLASQNAVQRRDYQLQAARALEVLSAPVPASREQAQAELAQLPSISGEEARHALAEAEAALLEIRVQHDTIARALQAQDRAPACDATELRDLIARKQEHINQLETEFRANAERLTGYAQATDDVELRSALASSDDNFLETLLNGARVQASAAQESALTLPELQRDACNKTESREAIVKEASRVARELGLVAESDDAGFEVNGVARAKEELAEIHAARQALPDEELARAVAQSRSTLGELASRISVLTSQQKQRQDELESAKRDGLLADFERAAQTWRESQSEVEKLSNVREVIAAQKLPSTARALHALVAAFNQKLQRAREDAAALPAALQNVKANQAQLETSRAQFLEIWQRSLPDTGEPQNAETALRALPIRASQLENELRDLDEEKLQRELETLQSQAHETHQLQATLRHQLDEAQTEMKRLRAELQAEESQSLREFEAQFEAREELDAAPQMDAAGWEREWQTRREAIAHNRSTRAAQAKASGLGEELLDLSAEREGLQEAERNIAVQRRAGEIVEKTRASIVTRVMPMTMQNIRQLLPLLTEGRYRDAEWDEAQNKILIYDNEARAMVRKHTFSGGARDQISLALRLAFALATLPGEHNIRPGFLFLDEPLSSFDRARTQALVDLLTRGLIRRHFQQIFLVSHSESFDPALFDFRLRLENGHVALSTLPT